MWSQHLTVFGDKDLCSIAESLPDMKRPATRPPLVGLGFLSGELATSWLDLQADWGPLSLDRSEVDIILLIERIQSLPYTGLSILVWNRSKQGHIKIKRRDSPDEIIVIIIK